MAGNRAGQQKGPVAEAHLLDNAGILFGCGLVLGSGDGLAVAKADAANDLGEAL